MAKSSAFWKYIFLCFITFKVILSLSIHINPPVETTLGNSSTEIICSWTTDVNDHVYLVSVKAYNKTDLTYAVIATFYPSDSREPVLANNGKYLADRVTLFKNSSNIASIQFHEVLCIDDNKYICFTSFDNSGTPGTQSSAPTTLTVKSNSSKPDSLSSDSKLNETEAGQNLTFTCMGNVGNPPGQFVWKKYPHGTNMPIILSNISTSTTKVSENCTYYGISNLTIQLTDQDNRAVIACVEERHTSDPSMELVTDPINVFYQVQNVMITKSPDKQEYIQDEDNQLNLSCVADGNPKPQFLWYKEDMLINTTTGSTLLIEALSVNDSGSYKCVASNSIGGQTYNSSAEILITVLSEKVTFPTTETIPTSASSSEETTTTEKDLNSTEVSSASPTSATESSGIIIAIVVPIVVVAVIIGIVVLCKFNRKNEKSERLKISGEEVPTRNSDPGYSTIPYDDKKPLVPSSNSIVNSNYTEIELPGENKDQSIEMTTCINETDEKVTSEDRKSATEGNSNGEVNAEYATVQKRPIKGSEKDNLLDNKLSPSQDENTSLSNDLNSKKGNYENPIITPSTDLGESDSLKHNDEHIDEKKALDNHGYEDIPFSSENQTNKSTAQNNTSKADEKSEVADGDDAVGKEITTNDSSVTTF